MTLPLAVDASDQVDYGSIDVFKWEGARCDLRGDWGHFRVEGDPPLVVYT